MALLCFFGCQHRFVHQTCCSLCCLGYSCLVSSIARGGDGEILMGLVVCRESRWIYGNRRPPASEVLPVRTKNSSLCQICRLYLVLRLHLIHLTAPPTVPAPQQAMVHRIRATSLPDSTALSQNGCQSLTVTGRTPTVVSPQHHIWDVLHQWGNFSDL